jgi:sigma-E factor negative regulatory protein RseA
MTAPASHNPDPDFKPWLSALADGERDALPPAAAAWRERPEARDCWHLYHLIGDVMRSDDLAAAPSRDATFLAALRTRLANEPVPMAPEPLPVAAAGSSPQARPRHLGWRAPTAVAAGVVAVVAATFVLLRPQGPVELAGAPATAGGPTAPAGGGMRVTTNPLPTLGGGLVAEGDIIRDEQLSAYLRAHQAARGGSPAALPGGGLRRAELLVVPVQVPVPAPAAVSSGSASGPR